MLSKRFTFFSGTRFALPFALAVLAIMCHGCFQKRAKNITATSFSGTVLSQAEHQADSGKIPEAIASLRKGFFNNSNLSIEDSFNYYMFFYNVNNRHYKNYKAAMSYADSMLRVLERNNVTTELGSAYAVAHYLKGDMFFVSGDYQNAYEEYYEGQVAGQAQLDHCTLSNYSYRLGMVLFRQKQFMEASVYFKECYNLLRNCNSSFAYLYRTQEVLNNIGLCYFNAGSPDSAAYYYKQDLNFLDMNQSGFGPHNADLLQIAKGVVYGNLGSVYYKKKDYKTAEQFFRQSIDININHEKELHDAQLTMLKLARLYKDMGDETSMWNVLMQVEQAQDTLPDKTVERDWNLFMSRYYEKRQPALAYGYLSRSIALRDSMEEQSAILQESDIREKLQNIERGYTIAALKRENRQERIYLGISLLGALICILAVTSAYYNLGRTRKYVGMLGELNSNMKEQKNQLQATLKELEQSHKEKDRILRVVAHDLRSPVAAIYGLADLMLDSPGITDEQQENLELIKTASNQSLTLSKELLDMAVTAPSNELQLKQLDICSFLHTQIELLRFRAAEKDQQITLELPETPIILEADPDKLGRVVTNLITNAIKFSNADTRITVKVFVKDMALIIVIRDQGIGIPESVGESVFDMFTEAKRYGTKGEKPFGLGLSISRQIVQAHRGSIWFETEEGAGTAFYVSLPLGAGKA